MKSKREREIYFQLNAEFQQIARRDGKAIFKQTEEKNRMGNMRDLLNKIGDIEETFDARVDTINDKNSKDLTEVEEIKKR